MSKAATLLNLFEATNVQKVKDIAKELLDRFFSEYDLPIPDIKIKNNLNPKWLARHVCFSANRENSNIEVQKSVLDDDRTLRRIIAHELIHHWQCFKEKDEKSFNPAYRRAMRAMGKDTGHGESFEKWAEKINSVMGDNYVTKKSDQEYLKSPSKEFYLVISPHDSGRFIYAYFQRPTDKTKRLIYLHKDAKVFRTNNVRFLRGRVFGTKGGWSIPSDQETQDTLKDMYSGEGIKF